MAIKEVLTFAAKELAPAGADLLAESMPRLAGKAIAAGARYAVETAEGVLPKIEISSFRGYQPYASNPASLKSMERLFDDPLRHELLGTKWSGQPTNFVDQWRYGVAPLSAPLETSGIHSCTGLSVVDRKAGIHYLAHIDSDTTVQNIVKSLSQFNFEQSSVRVLPGPVFFDSPGYGIHLNSRTNVEKTVNALQQIPNALKDFKFLHSNESPSYYSIVSHEGRLFHK